MSCCNSSYISPTTKLAPFYVDILASMISLLYEKSMARVRITMEHNEKCRINHTLNIQAIESTILIDDEMSEYEKIFEAIISDNVNSPSEREEVGREKNEKIYEEICTRLSILKRLRREEIDCNENDMTTDNAINILLASAFVKGLSPDLSFENLLFDENIFQENSSSDEEQEEEVSASITEEDISKDIECSCEVCHHMRTIGDVWEQWRPEGLLGISMKQFVSKYDSSGGELQD